MRPRRPLLRFLRLFWASQRLKLAGYLLFAGLRGVLPLIQIYLVKLIVDAVVAAVDSPDPMAAAPQIGSYILITALSYWLQSGATSLERLLRQRTALPFIDELYDDIHGQSVHVGLAYYENSDFRDSLHRAQQEALTRPAQLLSQLGGLVQHTVSLVGMAGLLTTVHWSLGPALLLASTPDTIMRYRFAKRWYRWEREHTPRQRRARYHSWVLTSTHYAKEVLLDGLGALLGGRFRRERLALRTSRLSLLRRQTVIEALAKGFAAAMMAAVFGFVAWRTVTGAITLGSLVLVIQGVNRGISMLQRELISITAVVENNLFLANLFEFLDHPPAVPDPPAPSPLPQDSAPVSVEDVSFRYPNRNDWALREVTFTLHPGEILAVVGSNGSGKTTLIKLLTRLYDPTEGQILYGGTDLRDLPQAELRARFSVIFQDFGKHHDTLAENIRLSLAGATPTPERWQEVLSAARIDRLAERLPKGEDTMLGTWFEGGVDLSEGQWQRVALARALLKESRIVILDEPSSALDVESERELITSLRGMLADRSAILISHRLSTVRIADRVLVLEDGEVVECDTPDRLLAADGRFAQLQEAQEDITSLPGEAGSSLSSGA